MAKLFQFLNIFRKRKKVTYSLSDYENNTKKFEQKLIGYLDYPNISTEYSAKINLILTHLKNQSIFNNRNTNFTLLNYLDTEVIDSFIAHLNESLARQFNLTTLFILDSLLMIFSYLRKTGLNGPEDLVKSELRKLIGDVKLETQKDDFNQQREKFIKRSNEIIAKTNDLSEDDNAMTDSEAERLNIEFNSLTEQIASIDNKLIKIDQANKTRKQKIDLIKDAILFKLIKDEITDITDKNKDNEIIETIREDISTITTEIDHTEGTQELIKSTIKPANSNPAKAKDNLRNTIAKATEKKPPSVLKSKPTNKASLTEVQEILSEVDSEND